MERPAGMYSRPHRPRSPAIAAIGLMSMAAAAKAPAQNRVARIDSVLQVASIATCRRAAPTPTSGNAISILRRGARILGSKDTTVNFGEGIRVTALTDVRLRVDPQFGNGTFFFAPQFGRCSTKETGRLFDGIPPKIN